MREIKFRGKAIMSIEELELMNIEHDNGWVYGNLIKNGNRPIITADILEEIEESIYSEWWAVVEPESVGQYTGLKDENGRDIYEGDIVRHATDEGVYEVIFEDGGFYVLSSYDFQTINEYPLEVIGNIFQDGDLLRDS